MHIVLVEDDIFFQKFYAHKLQESGFAVDVASNGEEGLKKIREVKPDLVLLDIIMPVLDGFGVLERKAKEDAIKHIPVLVFSTLGQESDVQKAKSLGANDYINKSFFDYEKLVEKINELLKK